jgi:hypothetical protein
MALVALASARSPGLTTSALALALSWPEPGRVLLAELDPDGGTIAERHAANPDPGLNTLAASGRHYLSPGMVTSNLQRLPGGLPVLLSSASPDRCVAALAALNPVGLGETLRDVPGFDVLADCGRIDSNSPALPVLREADAVIFVVRATLEDIVGLRARLETLDLARGTRAGIVVVDSGPHKVEDVAAAFTLPVVGALAWDTRAATALSEGRHVLGSSKLMRSAERLAADLAAQIGSEMVTGPAADNSGPLPPHNAQGMADQGVRVEMPSSQRPPGPPAVPSSVPSPAWTTPSESVPTRPAASWGATL